MDLTSATNLRRCSKTLAEDVKRVSRFALGLVVAQQARARQETSVGDWSLAELRLHVHGKRWEAVIVSCATGDWLFVNAASDEDVRAAIEEGRKNRYFGPLHAAAMFGQTSILDRLILVAAGTNVDAAAKDWATPLWVAAQNGHVEVVSRLVAAGANVDAAAKARSTPLHIAALYGHVEVVSRLVAADANVDAVDEDEKTPLHIAAQEGDVEVVSRLVAAGAIVDAAAKDGYTPLYMAADYGRIEVVSRLVAAGADASPLEGFSWNPLHIAVIMNDAEEMTRLLSGVADVRYIITIHARVLLLIQEIYRFHVAAVAHVALNYVTFT